MQNTHLPPTIKRLLIILGVIILVAGIAFVMVNFLKKVTPQSSNSLTPNHVTAASPQEVIATYTEEATSIFTEENYQKQTNTDAYVIYRAGGQTYTVTTPTKLHALFTAKKIDLPDDIAAVEQKTTSFMHEKGFDKINNTAAATAENPVYATYASSGSVCQLLSSKADVTAKLPSYHSLSCISKSDIDKEYAAIDSLLNLYRQNHQLGAFTQAVRSVKTEANKSLAIVSLSGDGNNASLLFAAIDTAWVAIGDLNSSTATNGKYGITPEIQAAINDPKYGDFLKKNIQ